ncbi:MAG: sensor histidine kinase [Oscillatoriaceae bacterium SKW80]|nr:sensor histidine kinase [Oscillatoriaceae bacterium SKYG93]MCX8120582.1 sensor histidine kinase [Oscillatoriaceae bacterium SKW80]MDW8453881.1 histidine kinase dimerization/phospho-acceptor domain-containing protein [Oscillatoriaceae cyanobacterium SKYGB_i_bin93]
MPKWFLPTLSEVLKVGVDKGIEVLNDGNNASRIMASRRKAEGFWRSALATLSSLLYPHQPTPTLKGLILCGPAPIFSEPAILANYSTWIFTATDAKAFLPLLPPATWFPSQPLPHCVEPSALTPQAIKLVANDPLINEKFCVVLTADFSLAMVVGENPNGEVTFEYSFEPEAIKMVWQALRGRVSLADIGEQACHLDALVEQFPPVAPSYKTVMLFGQLLVKNLPDWEEKENLRGPLRALPSQRSASNGRSRSGSPGGASRYLANQIEKLYGYGKLNKNAVKDKGKEPTQLQDVELLQALAHEIRTPLTTIRTLTRLLLKRATDPEMLKRLESIERECTEQIDRFNLIFRAVEMETSETRRTPVHLTSTPLAQIFNSCIPRWQKQASRRNLTLEVLLPPKMPSVVSDPTMLDQVLTGAIENFTASQPPGGHVQVEVTLAGHQLKVQLQCQLANKEHAQNANNKWPTLKSLGQLLMFQPETGNISLNLSVTKNLFQALGGKLIVRQRPLQGDVLTIYLPLETESTDFYRPNGGSGNIHFV